MASGRTKALRQQFFNLVNQGQASTYPNMRSKSEPKKVKNADVSTDLVHLKGASSLGKHAKPPFNPSTPRLKKKMEIG